MNNIRWDMHSSLSIHETVYTSIDIAVEEWIKKPEFDVWGAFLPAQRLLGSFLVIICAIRAMKNRIHTQSAPEILQIWGRFQKDVASKCTIDEWFLEEQTFVQNLLAHPLVCGSPFGEESSLSRIADFLEVPIDGDQIREAITFLEEQAPSFVQNSSSTTLDLLIATEFQCNREKYASLLLALLSLRKKTTRPDFLSNVHQAQAFCAAWNRLEEEKKVVSALNRQLQNIVITSAWAYGDTTEYFVLYAISRQEQHADFSWGARHVWIFEELLVALEFLWELKPQESILSSMCCTYPNAPECSFLSLKEGMYIDERSILGYESKERVFVEGDFWSVQGTLQKDRSGEEERMQQQANAELARLLLDTEDDLTED